jgi:hypothetical protein
MLDELGPAAANSRGPSVISAVAPDACRYCNLTIASAAIRHGMARTWEVDPSS